MESVLEGYVSKLVAKQVQAHLANTAAAQEFSAEDFLKACRSLIDSRFTVFFRELAGLASSLASGTTGSKASPQGGKRVSSRNFLQNTGDPFQERVLASERALSNEEFYTSLRDELVDANLRQTRVQKHNPEVGQTWVCRTGKFKGRIIKIVTISKSGVCKYQILRGTTRITRYKPIRVPSLLRTYRLVPSNTVVELEQTLISPKGPMPGVDGWPMIRVGQVWKCRTGRVIRVKQYNKGRIYPAVLKSAKGVKGNNHVRIMSEKYFLINYKLVKDVPGSKHTVEASDSRPVKGSGKRGPGLPNVGSIFVGKPEEKLGVRGRKIKITGYSGDRIIYKVLTRSSKSKHSVVRPMKLDSLRRLYRRVKAKT